jgi:hypothetical protein
LQNYYARCNETTLQREYNLKKTFQITDESALAHTKLKGSQQCFSMLRSTTYIKQNNLMKKWRQHMTVAIFGTFSLVYCANAQDSTTTTTTSTQQTTTQQKTTSDSYFYRAQELSVDVFGSGSLGEQTINNISGNKVEHNGRLGAGAGLNYFFSRYVGIGGDAYTENTAHNFIDSASGNLIGRLPIGDTGVAPYIFGGGGHQFDEVEQTFGQAGAGIEFRFAQHVGFFVDARYVFADKTQNYGVGRAGLRVNF